MQNFVVRKTMIEFLRKELLGPGSEGFSENESIEIIWERPSKRYSTGILFPMEDKITENDEYEHSEELEALDNNTYISYEYTNCTKGEEPILDSNFDSALSLSNQMKPSSMGFTFFAEGEQNRISVLYQYAKYLKAQRSDIIKKIMPEQFDKIEKNIKENKFCYNNGKVGLTTDIDEKEVKKLRKEIKLIDDWELKNTLNKIINYRYAYKRVPINPKEKEFLFKEKESFKDYKDGNIRIFLKKKYYKKIDKTSFTVVMINDSNVCQEKNIIFQPKLKVTSEYNKWNLVAYSSSPLLEKRMTDEEKKLELLFRNKQKYGIGHGVSVDYRHNPESWEIATEFMPDHEVRSMNFDISELSCEILSMENLSSISELSDNEILESLEKLVMSYSSWLEEKNIEAKDLNQKYQKAAADNLKNADESLKRMRKGIKVLRDNTFALRAFKDANLAMLMQRVQNANKKKNSMPSDEVKVIKKFKGTELNMAKWRAFQLAFFVMSVDSIVDNKSDYRDMVDLIWVPTGGGKTEAYLALTSFTIFYRRLRKLDESHGTAVIMRYTLRLLAAQQFIRAASIICACELIRKNNEKLYGTEEITVGLWIGSKVTPNTDKQAIIDYKRLLESESQYDIDRNYKFQLLECPWCGTKLVKRELKGKQLIGRYGLRKKGSKIIHMCTNVNCEFYKKLPISVVDEDIYNKPTTLLFATVDKFATLPWRGEVSEIFASGESRNATPELIIQDELHLISGPLGTIVALYESVIDQLCSCKGIFPKIIASTATIRNADEQVKNLYNREVAQFPPPILDIDDSFFIKSNKDNEEFGRKYIGLMASGKTQTTLEIRLFGNLLQSINTMECEDEYKDLYWTLVGYFNSIRELGKCTTLVNDDIKDYMRRISNRTNEKLRYIYQADELTSRVTSNDILRTLDKMELKYSKSNRESKSYTSDIVLATNMISVGVDVSRLNTMIIVGQPKLTAEYIQASSRVGRKDPGLVCTLFDAAKTRDRSHYENFKSYHESFYYYVEPTSITPFSQAAIDRALHALIISLMRHYFGYNTEESAGGIMNVNDYKTKVKEILLSRVKDIDYNAISIIDKKIDDFFEFWKGKADNLEQEQELRYSITGNRGQYARLIKDYGQYENENAYETLRAMRNVDTETKVHLRRLVNGK